MDLSGIALQGLELASAQLDAAAFQLAGGATSVSGSPSDTVSLSEEIVAMMAAKNLYSANLATLQTSEQLDKSVLNVMA
jgi:flagellar hook protein FlgE